MPSQRNWMQRIEAWLRELEAQKQTPTDERDAIIGNLRTRYQGLLVELAEAKAEIERLRPLIDIGELVRGMRVGTRLVRALGEVYSVDRCAYLNRADAGWSKLHGRWIDPAEALRGIQEVVDAEA